MDRVASEPDLELSFASGFEEESFKDIAQSLREGGAHVTLRRRPREGPYAFLEWLIPTAVIVLIVKPYLKEFSTETGKLHAHALHKGLSKLWNKVFGPKPEIESTMVGPSGKVDPQVFSPTVSVKMTRNDGGDLILLFPLGTSSEDFTLAVDRFMELMEQHYSQNGADPLTEAMSAVDYLSSPGFQALVYMNPKTRSIELVDYVASSELGKLTTVRLRGN